MSDFRERHGIVKNNGAYDQAVTTDEGTDCVKLIANDGLGSRAVFLTPNEARHIATKLRRLARRIDEKLGQ
jgi:hypothetical protein